LAGNTSDGLSSANVDTPSKNNRLVPVGHGSKRSDARAMTSRTPARTVAVIATLAAVITGCGVKVKAGPPNCATQAGIAGATSPFPRSQLPRPFPAALGTLDVSYTSDSGAHYAGRVALPANKVAVAVEHNPCSATLAQLGTVVLAESSEATPPGIYTQLLPPRSPAEGPTLTTNVQLAFKVDRGSPLLQAGSCATVGSAGAAPTVAQTAADPSGAAYALGLQAGLPFAHDLVCSTTGDSGSLRPPPYESSGSSENLPVGQAETLVNQIASQLPTYVLTLFPTGVDQASPCIVFIAPGGKIRLLSQADIPSGAADTALSDCTNSHISFTAAQ
jgi:hypothetical protein